MSLDVEDKSRAKDPNERGVEGHCSANMVQNNSHVKNKGNFKPSFNKPAKTTDFKKKKKKVNKAGQGGCYTCGEVATIPRTAQNMQIAKEKMAPRLSTS